MISLETFGWNSYFSQQLAKLSSEPRSVGRVIADYGGYLKVVTPGECTAEVSGKLKHAVEAHNLPKVGDWVTLELHGSERAIITHVLERRSEISRKAPGGKVGRQILAANIDVAFVVQALDGDFNVARLERYVYQLRQAAIEPVFIFNKADLAPRLTEQLADVEQLGVSYIITNALTGKGVKELQSKIPAQQTAVFLGSSGVGKSTLTNRLLGEERQKTAERREDDARGRHTTSFRELFILPNGGLIIDTPGIRELQLWADDLSLAVSFPDIETIAMGCEFRNCSHIKEANCAVRHAVNDGVLTRERLERYLKLRHELLTISEHVSNAALKAKKQRARRMRKLISDEEKLDEDGRLYD